MKVNAILPIVALVIEAAHSTTIDETAPALRHLQVETPTTMPISFVEVTLAPTIPAASREPTVALFPTVPTPTLKPTPFVTDNTPAPFSTPGPTDILTFEPTPSPMDDPVSPSYDDYYVDVTFDDDAYDYYIEVKPKGKSKTGKAMLSSKTGKTTGSTGKSGKTTGKFGKTTSTKSGKTTGSTGKSGKTTSTKSTKMGKASSDGDGDVDTSYPDTDYGSEDYGDVDSNYDELYRK